MIAIAFVNLKGGVSKTSSCLHTSYALARRGHRVLLVDADPQSSLSQGYFGPSAVEAMDPLGTIAAIYREGAAPDPESLIRPTGVERVWILPGSIAMTEHNTPDRSRWPGLQDGLRDFLRDVAAEYDLVLIDCPPNLHLCSWSALVAANAVISPVMTEDFGSQGLAPVARSIAEARRVNPGLVQAGYLLTMVDKRLAVHATYQEMLRERYGDLVFGAVVPRAKDFVEAVAMRMPVGLYRPRSAAAKAIEAVADELLGRLGIGAGGVAA